MKPKHQNYTLGLIIEYIIIKVTDTISAYNSMISVLQLSNVYIFRVWKGLKPIFQEIYAVCICICICVLMHMYRNFYR